MRYLILLLILWGCKEQSKSTKNTTEPIAAKVGEIKHATPEIEIVVLGTVQDAGAPQIACQKECCQNRFKAPDPSLRVVSLGLIDHTNQERYVFEATPDFPKQLRHLQVKAGFGVESEPDGIFLTHAHIGHYTGLMFLGREALNAKEVPVFAMPKMKSFLETNGPWSQLVDQKNIRIVPLENEKAIRLNPNIQVTPIKVPHRDEYSETVGFIIEGPNKKALFIPDIDKWERWDSPIETLIKKVDYAFLDATFYDGAEIGHRNIAEIPHPFIIESMQRFQTLHASEKSKIHFIHFNHTNLLLEPGSEPYQTVIKNGYAIAEFDAHFSL